MSVEINNESGIAVEESILQRLASFVLEFPKGEKPEYSPVVSKLVKSLHPAEGCTTAQGTAPAAQ